MLKYILKIVAEFTRNYDHASIRSNRNISSGNGTTCPTDVEKCLTCHN